MAIFEETPQRQRLVRLRRKEAEELARLMAKRRGLGYIDLTTSPVNIDALGIISEEDARAASAAVFQKFGRKLHIAVLNPDHPKTKALLSRLIDDRYDFTLFLVSPDSLERAWGEYRNVAARQRSITGEVEISELRLKEFYGRVKTTADIAGLLGDAKGRRTTDILEIILAGALALEASDVHLEPHTDAVRLRYRLDGVLADAAGIPQDAYRFILSRVKLIAQMKLNVKTRGQDGRFTIHEAGEEIEVRVSSLPGPYGENLVLRILNPKTITIDFDALGMQPWVAAQMARELAKPNGMILTTGPTGSGKTTTLYAFLKKIATPDVKIITLEDPIEYHLAGIEQTQVDPRSGYDFINGLRSILRQDPDVILVGEIRDRETAETAMHASLTGHLVFSTLHTNNAAGTIPRLLDLGVEPAIMAPAINVTMAQRLVRRLCAACKTTRPATREELLEIKKELDRLPKSIERPSLGKECQLANAKGCERCNHTGYKGRIAVFEIIIVDDAIEQLVFRKPSEIDMKNAAFAQGQITMRQDAIFKVLAGITDLAEVSRAVGEE